LAETFPHFREDKVFIFREPRTYPHPCLRRGRLFARTRFLFFANVPPEADPGEVAKALHGAGKFFNSPDTPIYYYLPTMLVCSILHTSIVHMSIEVEEFLIENFG